jgi:glycerol-3-phosphate O-acyltransferase
MLNEHLESREVQNKLAFFDLQRSACQVRQLAANASSLLVLEGFAHSSHIDYQLLSAAAYQYAVTRAAVWACVGPVSKAHCHRGYLSCRW